MTGILCQTVVRVATQEFFESGAGLGRAIKIVFVDFCNREQCLKAVFASGIFAPEKAVLIDGGMKKLLVVEMPPHLQQQVSDRKGAGIGLSGSRSAEINPPVGIQHALVIMPGALCGWARVESLAHVLGYSESFPPPGIAVGRTRVGRQCRQQCHQQNGTRPHRPSASFQILQFLVARNRWVMPTSTTHLYRCYYPQSVLLM